MGKRWGGSADGHTFHLRTNKNILLTIVMATEPCKYTITHGVVYYVNYRLMSFFSFSFRMIDPEGRWQKTWRQSRDGKQRVCLALTTGPIIFKDLFLLNVYEWLPHACTTCTQYLRRPEEGVGFPCSQPCGCWEPDLVLCKNSKCFQLVSCVFCPRAWGGVAVLLVRGKGALIPAQTFQWRNEHM